MTHGDPSTDPTWRLLYESALEVLPAALVRQRVKPEDVDDLVQGVLLAAYCSLDRYSPDLSEPVAADAAPAAPHAAGPRRPTPRTPPEGAPPQRGRLRRPNLAVPAVPSLAPANAVPSVAPANAGFGPPAAAPPDALRVSDAPAPGGDAASYREAAAAAAKAWLLGIAQRHVRHYHRRPQRRREIPCGGSDFTAWAASDNEDTTASVEARIARKERCALAIRLLGRVEPTRRAVLVLGDGLGLPMREVAAALGINENTARSRLHAARRDFLSAAKRLSPEERQALRLAMAPFLFTRDEATARRWGGADAASPMDGAPPSAWGPDWVVPRARSIGAWLVGAAAALLMQPSSPANLAQSGGLTARAAAWPSSRTEAATRPSFNCPARAGEAGAAAPAVASAAAGLSLPSAAGHWPSARFGVGQPFAGAGIDEAPAGAGSSESSKDAGARRPEPRGDARDPLAEERRLLALARASLERRDAAAAVESLSEHARHFLRGRLAAVRDHLLRRALSLDPVTADVPPPSAGLGAASAPGAAGALGRRTP